MAEDLGEKTEQPTAKRLSDARHKGQVARSQDLGSAVILIAAVVVLYVAGGSLLETTAGVIAGSLSPDSIGGAMTVGGLGAYLPLVGLEIARMLAPIMLVLLVIAVGAQVAQVGWLFTLKPLEPKLSRFDPIKGTKQLFQRRNLIKGVANIAKLLFASLVGVAVVGMKFDQVVALPALSMTAAFAVSMRIILQTAVAMLLALLIIGVIDYMYQKWQHTQDLKMSKQEVIDERKSTEGDPAVKARRLKMGREIVMQQIRSAVPHADVVVTNPTHYACALRYDSRKMNAPRLVAKGGDFMAMQIRLVAASHGVPIVERPPLARAIYHQVEVGREVPVELYEAVAEVLAYVYRLEGRAAS
ncbi:MAG: flagellar biosynthesis protein FlhB [Phycisphaeraceae bacterium]|nr:flagellar biosynthesis protein FlhB [Phycisphaeraceae bacterium]